MRSHKVKKVKFWPFHDMFCRAMEGPLGLGRFAPSWAPEEVSHAVWVGVTDVGGGPALGTERNPISTGRDCSQCRPTTGCDPPGSPQGATGSVVTESAPYPTRLETRIEQNGGNFWPSQGYCMQNNKFWIYRFLGHMTLKVIWPRKCKFAVISETVRDRAQRREFFYPCRVTACKITNLEFFDFKVTLPSRSHDLENVNLPLSEKP